MLILIYLHLSQRFRPTSQVFHLQPLRFEENHFITLSLCYWIWKYICPKRQITIRLLVDSRLKAATIEQQSSSGFLYSVLCSFSMAGILSLVDLRVFSSQALEEARDSQELLRCSGSMIVNVKMLDAGQSGMLSGSLQILRYPTTMRK